MPEVRVNHLKYGKGTIVMTRHKGLELAVSFDNGFWRWIPVDEVEETDNQTVEKEKYTPTKTPRIEVVEKQNLPQPLVPARVTDSPTTYATSDISTAYGCFSESKSFGDKVFRSRKMIEAFRLGIVPYDCVENFIFGRKKEVDYLSEWLHHPEYSTMLVAGEYGSGKTHILDYAFAKALKEGYATAYLETDFNEVPLYKPKRVYSQFIKNFRYRSKENGYIGGFRHFLKEAISRGAFGNHRYFKYLIGNDHEALWDWIEASESSGRPQSWSNKWETYERNKYSYLPCLYNYNNVANLYCYLLSSLGWVAKKYLGLKGMLLLFDETETLGMANNKQMLDARNFLEALHSTARNETQMLKAPKYTNFNYYSCLYDIPFLFDQPSGLKLIFAVTPLRPSAETNTFSLHDILDFLVKDFTINRVELKPLKKEGLEDIFRHIYDEYVSAYEFHVDEILAEGLFEKILFSGNHLRMFVKGCVEKLDNIRHNHRENCLQLND